MAILEYPNTKSGLGFGNGGGIANSSGSNGTATALDHAFIYHAL